MLYRQQKSLLRCIAIVSLFCFSSGFVLPGRSYSQEPGQDSVLLDLHPPAADETDLMQAEPEAFGEREPVIEPFYENPWFWIAIAVTASAAGATVYMMTQQDPRATLTMDQ